MEMRPASGAVVAAHRGAMVTQVVRVTNSMLGQKGLMIKMKIQYSLRGQPVVEQAQVSSFPTGY